MTLSEDLIGKALDALARWHRGGDKDRYLKGASDAYYDAARTLAVDPLYKAAPKLRDLLQRYHDHASGTISGGKAPLWEETEALLTSLPKEVPA